MTRGERNNNPGNINKGQGFQGEVKGIDSRFATFATPEDGIRALAVVLLTYQHKYALHTIDQIINRWAPPVENNTDAYAQDVAKRVGVLTTTMIELGDLRILHNLVEGIICHENGENIYTAQQIEDGCKAALKKWA